MNDTLRANVLFGRDYDEDYYWKVLGACALIEDLEVWPNSDLTVIGKDGINISGGQRARLALARTVYSRADIYFLDDPLSAVDAIVKRYILDNIILSTGLLGDKLRFVTSNADSISTLCNQIATVDNGSVSVKVQTPQVHTVSNRSTLSANKPKMGGSPSNELQTVTYLDKKQTGNILNETTGVAISANSSNCNSDKNFHYPKQWSHWDNTLYAIRICGLPAVVTAVLSALFSEILKYVLHTYKIDALRANSITSQANNSAMLTYIVMDVLSKVSLKLINDLYRYLNNRIIDYEYKQSIGIMLIRGLLFAPLSYHEESQSDDINDIHASASDTMVHFAPSFFMREGSHVGGNDIQASAVAEFQDVSSSLSRETSYLLNLPQEVFDLLKHINEFRNLAERDAEAPYVVDSCRPSLQWPSNGNIEICDYSMKYGVHHGYALKNVNLIINPGEKIGIVGRTGAGKSSLAKVLFRLIHENTSGSISIDGQDISQFGVGDYRPRLGMIPQMSSMFNGSSRNNLDPLNQFDIEEMWAALIKCGLAKHMLSYRSSHSDYANMTARQKDEACIREQWKSASWLKRLTMVLLNKVPSASILADIHKPHGLDRSIYDCFGRITSGQQQLFGLCRIIMRKQKIVVLDEATANVDLETDKSVQELIRKEFSDCTVLTIAHRLETIMNSDRIIVMDKGTIAEIGTPQELLAKDGMFALLVKTSDFGQ
ncbi:ATP-binding cassette glutathione S-conjugate transporter ycf1 [Coemansia sp. S16]|nr:ATP-binding cassette glutathione S-conjugate transporter ycf1 [Coemansia sp. S16]